MIEQTFVPIPENCHQIVVSIIDKPDDISATLYSLEKTHGKWHQALTPAPAVIGKHGLGKEKEGDLKSPAGLYHITRAFGWGYLLNELKLPWQIVTAGDIWVDDPKSSDYNQQIHLSSLTEPYVYSYEKLKIPQYKYSVVFDYNKENVVGLGSAIFLHVWKDPIVGTAGCTAVSEAVMFRLLHWLNIAQNPVIIQYERHTLKERYPELGVLPKRPQL